MRQIKLGPKKTKLVFEAVATALGLKNRLLNPQGRFDRAGRFYLGTACPHCHHIRTPSQKFPYSAMVHGRTFKHQYHQSGLAGILTESEFVQLARMAEKHAPDMNDNWMTAYKCGLFRALQNFAPGKIQVRFHPEAALAPEELCEMF
jgi:hypothetical protein